MLDKETDKAETPLLRESHAIDIIELKEQQKPTTEVAKSVIVDTPAQAAQTDAKPTPPKVVVALVNETLEDSQWAMISKISKQGKFPVIGAFFHPAYIICNTILFRERTTDQAGLSLGYMILSLCMLSLGFTFNGSLDTLISQNFGSGKLRMCRVYLNRQLYMATLFFMILVIPCLLTKQILMGFGQPEEVARQAATYVYIMIPGGLCYTWQVCYMKFLMGQRITIIGMYANITASCFHFILAPLLVIGFDLGIAGVAISSSLQFMIRFAICMAYAYKGKEFQNPDILVPVLSYHEDNFKEWKSQLILNFQAMSLNVWSWWAMDIFTVISSYMELGVLTAQYILRNITLLTFMIPVGIMTSSQIIVGNNIGKDNVAVAKRYGLMCFKTAVIWGFCTIMILLIFRPYILGLFTADPMVIDQITQIYALVLLFVITDCVQCVGQGIIRGLGKQGKASIGTVLGYWAIGIPASLLCVFIFEWGMAGLWVGPVLAIMFNFVFYFTLILKTDWQQIADEVQEKKKQKALELQQISK